MTDVADPVMNGEGEIENEIGEVASPQQEDNEEETQAEEMEGVIENDSQPLPDAPQPDQGSMGNQEAELLDEEEDEVDECDDLQINSNTNTQDGTDAENATLDETSMDISDVNIKTEEVDGINPNELPEDEEEEDQNSCEDSVPILLNNTSDGATKVSPPSSASSARNGEALPSEENSREKPLLSGLLIKKPNGPTNAKSSSRQSLSFSVSDGNTIVTELEEQVTKLSHLLLLKEKEWSAILRLKKHVEYALEQVQCTQRITKVQDGLNGPMSQTDIKACMNLIVSEKDAFGYAERLIEESIESTETENDSLQSVFPFRSQSQSKEATVAAPPKVDGLTATQALQKLCERKRKAMDDLTPGRASRLRIVDVQSNAPSVQSKVIGNGRKGAIVDVQSIIQSHRSLAGEKPGQKSSKKATITQSMNMTTDRQYMKTLEDLLAMAETDKQQKDVPVPTLPAAPTPTPQLNRTAVKPKNGKPPRQSGGGNSLLATPTPSSSGTLAKMLSPSTHSSIATNRSSNEVSANSQKFASKLPNADANLSLANLLASSKVDTKVNISKIKKERNAREEDATHVPSQQEAVPICQGCNLSRAQFVCAGCANQWYCSRECQVAAWDEHSEICSG
ncbi:unnamed protein product [Orchesella dallaii]|uniref:MYND-type domain-containing protein n=1 Tax=Orchesella dallaii TaxID=48710 RepID=A0ABP1RL54_9HEXA